ncbi:FliM/FliN family flagellar motor C-terminal domain-containing protein [Mangrovicoccus sp. HB161399]|uniref:FliM/FliN family flagellar motor C-terminal domain-containing protein n=1 Tax=Mangrovicoccus sp. HB161399 TaxID=2720392 RepID=UPI0015564078|nr:FliM/FliN family flagellar motor C-terminal domain-containing protein [Mangrovicoccus sp. HB161399]
MTNEKHAAIIHSMTRAGRPPPEFGEVSPAKALRLALAKAGQEVLGQVVTGSGIEEMKLSVAKIAESLPEGALVVELDGPRGCRGLLALDRGLVCAITESLTTGRISAGDLPDRSPSRTDALLSRKFLVMVLTVFAARLVGHPAAEWATGFVPDDPVEDLRRLPVTMEDVPYRMLRMEIDFALGARLGPICIVLPWDGTDAMPPPPEALPPPEEVDAEWQRNIEGAVMGVRMELRAVLGRKTMSISDLRALAPDDVIRLPTAAIEATELVAPDGHVLFTGKLGDLNGYKAVKIGRIMFGEGDGEDGGGGSAAEEQLDLSGLVDAMADAPPSDLSLPSFEDEPDPELPPLDLDALEAGEGLPDLGGGEFPAMDLSGLNMDDLDDLPETID